MKTSKVFGITAVALSSVLALSACSTGTPNSSPAPVNSSSSKAAPSKPADAGNYTVSDDLSKAPEIVVSKNAGNVDKLLVVPIVEGSGATVQATDTITVQYTGIGAISGKEFDSSWSRGATPISFPLNGVIPGWTEGLTGTKVGGRYLLVIPGDLAYGDYPPTPDIQPGETLIFVVDIISIDSK